MNKLKNKLKSMIAEIKGDESLKERINDQTNILSETGLDSLQLINLIMRLDDEFDIEIDIDQFDFSCLNSFDTFCNFISGEVGIR